MCVRVCAACVCVCEARVCVCACAGCGDGGEEIWEGVRREGGRRGRRCWREMDGCRESVRVCVRACAACVCSMRVQYACAHVRVGCTRCTCTCACRVRVYACASVCVCGSREREGREKERGWCGKALACVCAYAFM